MSNMGLVVNILIFGVAVSIPAAVNYETKGQLPDLAATTCLLLLTLIVFRLLGVPTLVESLSQIDEVCSTQPEVVELQSKFDSKLLEEECDVVESQEEDVEENISVYEEGEVVVEDEAVEEATSKVESSVELSEDSAAEELSDCSTPVPVRNLEKRLARAPSDVSSADSAIADIHDPYICQLPALEAEFISLADTKRSPESWETILAQSWGKFSIEIHRRVGSQFLFRYIMHLEATPEEAIDLLADVTRRPVWDELCDEAGVVEKVSDRTTVQYFRTKAAWPTKSRCALVVSFNKQLSPRRYLNVSKSINTHPSFHANSADVRMIAHIAGQLVEPDAAGRDRMCRVVQVVDGDLGGWLPKSVVNMVTINAIPVGMRKANKMLKGIEVQRDVSEVMTEAEGGFYQAGSDSDASSQTTPVSARKGRMNVITSKAKSCQTTPVSPRKRMMTASVPISPVTAIAAKAAHMQSDTIATVSTRPTTEQHTESSSLPTNKALTTRTTAQAILLKRPNVLRFILTILRRSQPWIIVSILLAIVTGRFKR
ncbi:uncharacterized protein EV422DRAFT_530768 [Fimicolochytrium jonesii]|uniref:uncharacterized protein n=1 Tax=Fimicolochytrium jonesii TaxID=1396493 RepID=UPI0022FDCBA4|nr:uncharacterized protein EV422DRAFT_530768 [Fimicolochytrium jonesii]KAI8820399.1 hypothetical protein EV422DRAFT_530768 [Fimicolochytrium jonesii]